MKRIQISIFVILKEYLDNSSIHGLRYLTENGRLVVERLFWICAVIASFYGTYLVTTSSYEAYKDKPISFATETDYLHWNTNFPAVSICESDYTVMTAVTEFVKKYRPGKESDFQYLNFLSNVGYYSGNCVECDSYCDEPEHQKDCQIDFKYLTTQIRTSCEKLVKDCLWNGEVFNCCSKFITVESEKGPCLTINNIRTQNIPPLMISNKFTGPGILQFKLTRFSEIFIQGPHDVPFHNLDKQQVISFDSSSHCKLLFKVLEAKNDYMLQQEDLDRRDCRFPSENPLKLFPYYSFSNCLVECRAMHQLQLCNCTHHMIPNTEGTSCNATGLACLYKKVELFTFRTKEYTSKKAIVCNCNASCVEPEFHVVYNYCEFKRRRKPEAHIRIEMVSLPTERLKRNLVRSKLDLVVSVGGTAGLFLGASLLSFAEILIYFCVRPFSNKYKNVNN